MFSLQQGNSFQNVPLPYMDPMGWASGKYDSRNAGSSPSRPTTCLEMEKPVSMPQQEYSSMTKSKRRQLPDPRRRDRFINHTQKLLILVIFGFLEQDTDHQIHQLHHYFLRQLGWLLYPILDQRLSALYDILVHVQAG